MHAKLMFENVYYFIFASMTILTFVSLALPAVFSPILKQ